MEEIKQHIIKLILATKDIEEVHSLVHTLETVMQCQHMDMVFKPADKFPDFPNAIDFD